MTTDANTLTMKAVAAKGSVSVVHGAAFLGGHYILRLYLDGKLNTDSLVRVLYIRDQYQYLLAEGYGGEFLKFSSPNTHRAFELAAPAKLLVCDIYVYGQTGVIAKGIMHLMWVPEALISDVGPTIDLVGPKGDKGDPGHYYRPSLRPEGAEVFVDWMHSEKPNENIKGYINIRGPKGDTGIQGPPGLDGTVKFEDLTDEQLASLKGEKGDKGDKGDPGEDGAQGPRGFTGPQGPQGPQGGIGLPGVDGVDGKDGVDGLNGSDGIGINSVTLDKRQVESGNSPNPYELYLIITFTDGTTTEVPVPDIKAAQGVTDIDVTPLYPDGIFPGGQRVTITYGVENLSTSFDILNGATGATGATGADGVGVSSIYSSMSGSTPYLNFLLTDDSRISVEMPISKTVKDLDPYSTAVDDVAIRGIDVSYTDGTSKLIDLTSIIEEVIDEYSGSGGCTGGGGGTGTGPIYSRVVTNVEAKTVDANGGATSLKITFSSGDGGTTETTTIALSGGGGDFSNCNDTLVDTIEGTIDIHLSSLQLSDSGSSYLALSGILESWAGNIMTSTGVSTAYFNANGAFADLIRFLSTL